MGFKKFSLFSTLLVLLSFSAPHVAQAQLNTAVNPRFDPVEAKNPVSFIRPGKLLRLQIQLPIAESRDALGAGQAWL